MHFSARVVALNARAAQQQKDIRSLTAINAALTQELEELRAHRSRAADGPALENGELLYGHLWQPVLSTLACCCPRSWLSHCLS